MKNEVFVNFTIKGFKCDPVEISKVLMLKPTKIWKKGELRFPNGLMKYKENGWQISIQKKNITDVDSMLNELILLLSQSKDKILSINGIKKEFLIAIYFKGSTPSIVYDNYQISFFNEINATVAHDIYPIS